ncbi:MAG: substrate-binding domain-containing protein [Finegoldia sp.]|nr:substrate-binding domain-containing protein [Finegoldia sp.]
MKIIKKISLICASLMALVLLSSCSNKQEASSAITLVSREDGSGTRGAFTEITDVLFKDEEKTEDNTSLSSIVQNSTNAIMMTVAQDPNAIGYISLGSLNDSVKALSVDGVKAEPKTVESGEYKISRPFILAYKDDLSDPGADFLSFIESKQGDDIILAAGYQKIPGDKKDYEIKKDIKGELIISGSTSVTPLMEKLTESYKQIYPEVNFEIQSNGSSAGIQDAIRGTSDIGMASRELENDEGSDLKSSPIAIDAIAVIVNKENPIENLDLKNLKDIYTGKITDWSALK